MDKKEKLFAALEAEYRARTPKSLALHRRAGASMIKGGSHNLRLWRPYPFFMAGASGAEVEDVDGHLYIDYWQGHYANILGHDPAVLRPLPQPDDFSHLRPSLHSGFEGESQVRLAETILDAVGYDDYKIRFTTSGTLAAMYAVMLALAHTGRDRVLKIGGGWHGASPFLLKGVKFHPGAGYDAADSAGIPQAALDCVDVVPFNDGGIWRVVDIHHQCLPISPRFPGNWRLLALSGGHPITLFGEWNGLHFLPLSAIVEGENGRYTSLT